MKSHSSQFCLSCGLCCNGTLHAYTSIHPDEVDSVRILGLEIVPRRGALGFQQPCRLYQNQCCSNYDCRPSACKDYQCALLHKYLVGELKAEAAAQIIQRSKELFAALLRQLPAGYSFAQFRTSLDHEEDLGQGLIDADELLRTNRALLLTLSKLIRYLEKHFGKPE
jgi:uncharacterized protein